MNDMSQDVGPQERAPTSSFVFTGTWREFLPIALSNLALTIVTLGIYRFWAKARERRYLWSRTHFIDDSLEWTGTGKEMFVGFLIVMAAFIPLVLFISFGLQALLLRGAVLVGFFVALLLYGGFFYLYHVAHLRGLRYRLSRTYWHGIRGGSDDGGWGYGLTGVWKMGVAVIALGFLVPWALVQLWNRRWGAMSYGPHPIEAHADNDGLMGRYLLVYLAPLLAMGVVTLANVTLGVQHDPSDPSSGSVAAVLGTLFFYLVIGLASLNFYALFYSTVVSGTSVAGLNFEFTAETKDWVKLYLGHIGLAIATLGVGLIFLSYRNWSFKVRHMEASGVIDLEWLTQSTTRAPGDSEGLADAFDIGAI